MRAKFRIASLLLAAATAAGAGLEKYLEPVVRNHDFNGVVLVAHR